MFIYELLMEAHIQLVHHRSSIPTCTHSVLRLHNQQDLDLLTQSPRFLKDAEEISQYLCRLRPIGLQQRQD